MYKVGIDVGGTKINFVLVRDSRVVKTQKIATPKNKEELIRIIGEWVEKSSRPIRGIGIGVPGPLNANKDLILNPPNLRILRNCPLAKIVAKKTGIKSRMENDANCFTLAEALLGAGKGAKIVFGITLGTGVGGGIVINKKIYQGAFGSAGEVGHMTIKFDGLKCGCGNYGCLEAYCSKNVHGDYGRMLGVGLASVINLLDPEVIVVGGGISNEYECFINEVKKEIKERAISPLSQKYVKIKKAALGEIAGAIGAALMA